MVTWRFGTIGAASNYILTLFFGIALLCWTAAFFGHTRTLRAAGVSAIVLALLLSLLVVDFVLSVLQLRGGVPQAGAPLLWAPAAAVVRLRQISPPAMRQPQPPRAGS